MSDISDLPSNILGLTHQIRIAQKRLSGGHIASRDSVLRALLFALCSDPNIIRDRESAERAYTFTVSLATSAPQLIVFSSAEREAEYVGLLNCRSGRRYVVELALENRVQILVLDALLSESACQAISLVARAIASSPSFFTQADGILAELEPILKVSEDWITEGIIRLCAYFNFYLPRYDVRVRCKVWNEVCTHMSASRVLADTSFRVARWIMRKSRSEGDNVIILFVAHRRTREALEGTAYSNYTDVVFNTPRLACPLYISTMHLLI